MMSTSRLLAGLALALAAGGTLPLPSLAQEGAPPQPGADQKAKPDFPTWKETADGYEQVHSPDKAGELYGLWVKEKDNAILAELPRGWQNQKHMIAMTTPKGELFAGLQMGDRYVYWKRFDKRLALIEPQIETRSTGDTESKDSILNHFTDKVLLDVPIVCMGPNGQPVIDLKNLLVGNASNFYGRLGTGANTRLATLAKAKAFPENIVVSFEMPTADGTLKTFSYSISSVPDNTGYKPRKADERVGYFTTSYRDLGKFKTDEVWTRYINRWNLEKADGKLKMSPPKKPIIFYIEHTVPVRYRRWVKEGVLHWNKAYAQVGISDAIEVYFQDKETGAHMEKDPEDVRYNFIRWLSNDIGTAVGPHRSHPLTGQILDADIVLTDGWIRHFWYQANEFLPQQAMEGMSPETLEWLAKKPQWDPRVRLAPPNERAQVMHQLARQHAMGVMAYGGRPVAQNDAAIMANPELAELFQNMSPDVGVCMAANGKAMDMAVAGLSMEVLGLLEEENQSQQAQGPEDPKAGDSPEPKEKPKEDKKPDDKDAGDIIDGIPEWFLGPMLADLTCHEVGHTLGLRHNFRASSIYSLKDINSAAVKGQKAFAGSVMDYIPVNIDMKDGEVQGDYTMIGVGPYDMWAIEYGYTFNDPKDVLKRVNEGDLTYATDEDTGGPDPLARRYDFSADPRDYAISRMKLAKFLRERILDKFVKDGESWSKARRGYQITLGTQTDALNIMSSWLGGAFVNRDKKGDPGNRSPIAPVPVAQQRAALKFVIDNAFTDEAFGLTPDLLQKMTVDKWDSGAGNPRSEPTFPVHDRIIGVQASTLTMLMNPTTLRRVYDNEFLIPRDQDALTLPELMDSISAAIWGELDGSPDTRFSERQPLVSSLRRNLQREHMERLIDLTIASGMGAADKPIANLATMKLREIEGKIGKLLGKNSEKIDAYTVAHLTETRLRITKALDANYVYNLGAAGGGEPPFYYMGQDAKPAQPSTQPEGGDR
jgi:hypothetical protein